MKCGHEGISAFVVTRGDPTEVFQAAEHALNSISAFLQDGTEAALPSTVRLERDVWRGATGFNQATDSISVIGLVREDDDILRQRRQEPSRLWRIFDELYSSPSAINIRQPFDLYVNHPISLICGPLNKFYRCYFRNSSKSSTAVISSETVSKKLFISPNCSMIASCETAFQ